jgi:hypothetical protein
MGKVDVVITVGTVTFGYSVDAHITEDKLQRIAGNVAKMALEGCWVAIATKGDG